MKVMKFGGTSVGTPERMKSVATMVSESGEQVFVVLSAMSGTTNSLIEISNYLYKKNSDGANDVINNLEQKYMQHVEELYSTDEYKQRTREFLASEFNYLRSFTKDLFTSFEEKNIVAQGEIISTNMVTNFLQEQGAVTLTARLTTCCAAVATLRLRSSERLCLPRRFRYGPISTVCTTTTRAWSRRPRLYVSSTLRKLPNLLTSAQRFCTLLACSRLSSLAYQYASRTLSTRRQRALSSTTCYSKAKLRL